MNAGVGAGASLALLLVVATICAVTPLRGGAQMAGLLAGVACGFVLARCVTSELDNRLLRAAVCSASAAPAAHPDTVHDLALAAPDAVYRTVESLKPRHAVHRS